MDQRRILTLGDLGDDLVEFAGALVPADSFDPGSVPFGASGSLDEFDPFGVQVNGNPDFPGVATTGPQIVDDVPGLTIPGSGGVAIPGGASDIPGLVIQGTPVPTVPTVAGIQNAVVSGVFTAASGALQGVGTAIAGLLSKLPPGVQSALGIQTSAPVATSDATDSSGAAPASSGSNLPLYAAGAVAIFLGAKAIKKRRAR